MIDFLWGQPSANGCNIILVAVMEAAHLTISHISRSVPIVTKSPVSRWIYFWPVCTTSDCKVWYIYIECLCVCVYVCKWLALTAITFNVLTCNYSSYWTWSTPVEYPNWEHSLDTKGRTKVHNSIQYSKGRSRGKSTSNFVRKKLAK